MKPIVMIVAACAALLFVLPAEAKLFHRQAAEVRVAVSVAQEPAAKPQAVVVGSRQGTRRLRLGERIKARIAANRAIRAMRVPTVEQVVTPVSLGVECSGCER